MTAAETAPERSAQPAIFDLVFLTWVVVAPLVFHDRLLNSDGDLPRHLRLGQWMLDHHGLVRQDFFSWTKAGQPFVAFEWLSELIYAQVYRLGGLPLIAVFAGILLGLAYALQARLLLRRGVDPLLAFLVAMASAALGAVHWLARPHLFTYICVLLLLGMLERDPPGRRWPVLALFIIWGNLHGGFFYGWVLIGLYLTGALIEGSWGEGWGVWGVRARHYAALLALAILGVFCNPHGAGLVMHVVTFLRTPYLLNMTNEFLSPDFHSNSGKLFLAALMAVLGALVLTRQRISAPRALVAFANVAFALQSQRNMPLFGLVGLTVLALHHDGDWRSIRILRRLRGVFERDERARRPGPWAGAGAAAMLVLGIQGGQVGGVSLLPGEFDSKTFPVRAVTLARQAGLAGRMFHEFIWGGYILLRWPEQRVFIDGGTDFYGEDLFREAIETITLRPGWRDTLDRRRIDLVLLPVESPMAHELARDSVWGTWYCDSTAVFLVRRGAAVPETPAGSQRNLTRCYAEARQAEESR